MKKRQGFDFRLTTDKVNTHLQVAFCLVLVCKTLYEPSHMNTLYQHLLI